MVELFLTAFYFTLPAYFANMAPTVAARFGWLKFLDRPVDNGRKFNGQPVFGKNKTWRGLFVGIIAALTIAGFQTFAGQVEFFAEISLLDYCQSWFWFGILAGLGAVLGDLLKSFFKRRLAIGSGHSWPIFDQLDFLIGFFAAVFWLVRLDWKIAAAAAVLTLILHPLTNLIAFSLKIKKVWW